MMIQVLMQFIKVCGINKEKEVKTNIAIKLNDEQRLDLAQKYNNTSSKKLLTRAELNKIVQDYISVMLKAPPVEKPIKPVGDDPLLDRRWNCLTQLREHLVKENQVTILGWDWSKAALLVQEQNGNKYGYALAFGNLSKRRV